MLSVKDGGGNPTNMATTVDGASEHRYEMIVADPATPSRKLTVTSTGAAKVDGSGVTQPTQDASDGPVAPGAAASKSSLAGGQYNATLPTLTDGQQAAAQVDSRGRQIVAQSDGALLHVTVDGTVLDQADGPVAPGTVAAKSALIGAQYKASPPSLTDGQQAALQCDSGARLIVVSPSGSNFRVQPDGGTAPNTNFNTPTLIQLTAQAAGSGNSADQTNGTGRGLHLAINISTITGTSPTLTVTIQGKDPGSSTYYTILASAALTASGLTILRVYPGLTAAANTFANDIIPYQWRVAWAVGGTGAAVTAVVTASIVN